MAVTFRALNFNSIVVGYCDSRELLFAARVRNGFTPSVRDSVFKSFRGLAIPKRRPHLRCACAERICPGSSGEGFGRFHKLEIKTCPFSNLPQRYKGRWGQGLTADKMAECCWLRPQLVTQIEYAD